MHLRNTTRRRTYRPAIDRLEDRVVLSAADPAIAYVSSTYKGTSVMTDLKVMNEDGSNQVTVWPGSIENLLLSYPTWSPDLDGNPANGYQGTLAVQVQYTNKKTTSYEIDLLDVDVVNGQVTSQVTTKRAVSPNVTLAASNGSHLVVYPTWSPDEDPAPGYQGRLAYMTTYDGYNSVVEAVPVAWNGDPTDPAVQLKGTLRTLFQPAPDPGYQNLYVGFINWDPFDVNRMAFSLDQTLSTDAYTSLHTLEIIDLSTQDRTRVVTANGSFLDVNWSPDASQIAFAFNAAGTNTSVLQTVAAQANQTPQTVTTLGYESIDRRGPTWSPDGPLLAFSSASSKSSYRGIRSVSLASNQVTTLAEVSKINLNQPNWRPFLIPTATGAATVQSTATSGLSQAAMTQTSTRSAWTSLGLAPLLSDITQPIAPWDFLSRRRGRR